MSKKYPPPLLIKLDSYRLQAAGSSQERRTSRKKMLSDVISQLYTSGWYYDEVLEYMEKNKLFLHESTKIANHVYTRDSLHNPFGYWYTFDCIMPLQALYFATTVLGMKSLSTAGYVFTIILLNDHKRGSKSKLKQAIVTHDKEEILKNLRSLSNDCLHLEHPSDFLGLADISNFTRNQITEKINKKLNCNIRTYFEKHAFSGIKMRLWIDGHKTLVKEFRKYCKANQKRFTNLTADLDNDIFQGIKQSYNYLTSNKFAVGNK